MLVFDDYIMPLNTGFFWNETFVLIFPFIFLHSFKEIMKMLTQEHHNITKIVLKLALNTNQSIN